jgi:hypothetical protein
MAPPCTAACCSPPSPAWPAARAIAQDNARGRATRSRPPQLHAALSERFPLQLGIGGLLELRVSAPSLHLLPARNRIGAGLVAEVGGLPLQQVPPGELDVLFTVRYEPSDRTIRARDPELAGLRLAGPAARSRAGLQKMLPSMAREAFDEVVLHSLHAGRAVAARHHGLRARQGDRAGRRPAGDVRAQAAPLTA